MENEIGASDLVEGRFERFHKGGGQFLDEAHGVGHGDLAPFGKLELARGGIQGGEQFVVAENIGAGQAIDQRALPGVRVAGKSYFEHAASIAALALERAHVGKAGELAANARDALAHHATVDLQLALALAEARADATSHAIGRQMRPHAAQTRVEVLVLGQAHLQPPLLGSGVEGEDVQDERRAIDHLHGFVHYLLEVRLLRRCQLVVEDDQICLA